jgi:hypothetical protein
MPRPRVPRPKPPRFAIRWNGELIGYMEDPSLDMFWLYGRWISAGHPDEARLMARLPDPEYEPEDGEVPYNDQWVQFQRGDGSWTWMLLITGPRDRVIDLRSAVGCEPRPEELRRQALPD